MTLEGTVLMRDLIGATTPWRTLFERSAPVEMSVVGAHVLSMLVAGGLALSYDRASLRAARWTADVRAHHIAELHAVHRVVVAALAICMASGLLLFGADIKTFVVSVPFWIKMSLIALLLGNALVMTASEASLRLDAGGAAQVTWSRIRTSSIVSMVLWAAIVLVSIVLSLSK
jgi:hypothetical protein